MKRTALIAICLSMVVEWVYSQQVNLITIPNQSAHFIRMPSRESSTEIDAVFQNPAGLVRLEEGFHLSINNQFVRHNTKVSSDYEYLNQVPNDYDGKVRAYFFPSIMGAYKMNKFTFSGGIFLVGGGGGAAYENLPSADMGIADVGPALNIALLNSVNGQVFTDTGFDPGYNNITGYDFDFYSNGVAYYPGYQLGASYQFNNYVAVGLAGRYVSSTIKSEGHVKDIQINVPEYGGLQSPTTYLNFLSGRPDISNSNRGLLKITAGVYENLSGDRYISVIQKGYGFTPIFSVHSTPFEKLDVALKYEHATKVILKTKVIDGKDGEGQYTDGEEIRADLPAFISGGAKYQLTPRLLTAVGSRYFFIKGANYNGREKLVKRNYFEVDMALEYDITNDVLISGGYTFNKSTVDKNYQNEVDYSLPGHTFALGGAYNFNEDIRVNLGVLFTKYNKDTQSYEHVFANRNVEADPIPYNMTFDKNVLLIALGIDFNLVN